MRRGREDMEVRWPAAQCHEQSKDDERDVKSRCLIFEEEVPHLLNNFDLELKSSRHHTYWISTSIPSCFSHIV